MSAPADGTGAAAALPPASAADHPARPAALRVRDYVSYGAMRAPLALLELPLFVLLPTFYAERLGMDLTLVGAILFLTRLVDAVADPVIGIALDARRAPDTHRRAILWSLPMLALGFAALFSPPAGVPLAAWLATASVVTYIAYSAVSISYQAWGARLGDGPVERVRVTASREAFGLLGVLLSASLLMPDRAHWLVLLFFVAAALAAIGIRRAPLPASIPADDDEPGARHDTVAVTPARDLSASSATPARDISASSVMPAARDAGTAAVTPPSHDALAAAAAQASGPMPPAASRAAVLRTQLGGAWRALSANRAFRWILGAFMINGIATAIPATLVLFYVGDVLQQPERAPMFLVAYFLAAAVGMPAWVRIARLVGLRNAWLLGMALAVFAFVWAFGLRAGDSTAFFAVCIVTGFALGADLAMPPALLATVLAGDEASRAHDGACFGVWNLATKINLAAAAGLALPLLGALGYAPGAAAGGTLALSATYALLPSALKLAAGMVLLLAPLPSDDRLSETRA